MSGRGGRAAFRIVQEALTNVRKHAPGAKVRIRLRCTGQELRVEIHNAATAPGATPSDLPSGGHGLIGLSERVYLPGGSSARERTASVASRPARPFP